MHIPFCKQACHYCNFHFTTSLFHKNELVTALLKEIEMQKDFFEGEKINTIYFGGGTPSLLPIADCRLLIDAVHQNFNVATDAEITLEANPDDINAAKLSGWKETGINRLSIGIQSFFEEELKWMNRAHTAEQARESLQLAIKEFDNITIDLIYGSPLLTDEMWKQNIQTAIQYDIPHLSCYALTVEEKTPLIKLIHLNKTTAVDSDKQAGQFLLSMQWLRAAGYEHYEVSNFAKTGYRSRHNSSYWKGDKYLGIGPSAHSYNGFARQWNIANNQQYIASITAGALPIETEVLTPANQLNEYIMISLRTTEGINMEHIEKNWGGEMKKTITQQLLPYLDRGLVRPTATGVQLTDEGMLRADGIAAHLFKI
ncbi:MAG TPA: radical SAM family heme chaperone HemW [Chitinophagaceae bacterium]|nr:radical SAM family heme chaperone HemW [Chitinophagaceae bacterium]